MLSSRIFTRFALLGLILISFSCPVISQNNFRVIASTTGGGSDGYGGIISVLPDGSKPLTAKVFNGNQDGANPTSPPIQGSDGFLYGTNSSGGANRCGTIYKIKNDGTNFTVLYRFKIADGVNPGKLLQASNGDLYGMTMNGGIGDFGGAGVIYKIKTDGTGFVKLFDFAQAGAVGRGPHGGLIQASDGELYGMTTQGGPSDSGIIFKIKLDGSGYQLLYQFGSVAGYPFGNLFQASDGVLYGMTSSGPSGGILFKINLTGSGFVKLIDFNGANGSSPIGNIIQDSNGKLYGTTPTGGSQQGGVIFSINMNGSGFTKLHEFNLVSEFRPIGSLAFTSTGDLFGVCAAGGLNATGVVFTVGTDGNNYIKLADLGTDLKIVIGDAFLNAFIKASDGNYYGTSQYGGSGSNGLLFKITAGGVYTKLKDYPQDIVFNQSALIQATNKSFYGVAKMGGINNGNGIIFKISQDGTGYQKLFDFDSNTGGAPTGNLFQASDGDLYGHTLGGGLNGQGTLFKIKLDGTGFTKLKDFGGSSPNGSYPRGSLIQLSTGALVGTCSGGGTFGKGMIYKINLNGTGFSILYSFNGTSGGFTPIDLILSQDGNLYGMCIEGGVNNFGTIYKISTTGTGFTVLLDFDGTNKGSFPQSTLYELSDGALFGSTTFGGASDMGTVFKINKDGTGFVKLKDLDNGTGKWPQQGKPVVAPNGDLYAMTNFSIFKVSNTGSNFTRVIDWNALNTSVYSSQLTIALITDQTISFPAMSDISVGDTPITLAATATSLQPVTFTSSDNTLLSISGSTATGLIPGHVVITASHDGNLQYGSASATQSICVNPRKPVITVGGINLAPIYNSSNASGNQWYFNGSAISGATNVSFKPTDPGIYTVKTTVQGCTSQSSDGQTLNFVVTGDIPNTIKLDDLKIYPNPAKNEISIDLGAFESGPVSIEIMDLSGKKIESRSATGGKITHIEINLYKPGMYVLRANQTRKELTSRFMKE